MNNYQSIPFKDEDGKEKEFYVLEQTTLNGFHYLLVEDGSADADDEEVEVLIMKRVADAAEDEEWATYEMVEDEEELISVSNLHFLISSPKCRNVGVSGGTITARSLRV